MATTEFNGSMLIIIMHRLSLDIRLINIVLSHLIAISTVMAAAADDDCGLHFKRFVGNESKSEATHFSFW